MPQSLLFHPDRDDLDAGRALPQLALALCGLLLAVSQAFPAQGDTLGVNATEIVLGQTAALSGPAGKLGAGMRDGLLAAFAEANAEGGVHGRRLRLVSLDDRYEPRRAIANVNQLRDTYGVFALIGAVGTPTSLAIAPMLEGASVPFIAPFTGADGLRSEALEQVVNVRASYADEALAIVDWLVEERGIQRIAVLYQDDSFGLAGLAGVEQALARRSLRIAASGAYERNSLAVKRALLTIARSEPEAVVLVSAYEPAARFVQWAVKIGLDVPLVGLSFASSDLLAESLSTLPAEAFPELYVSQVVSDPRAPDAALATAYRFAVATHLQDREPGFVAFEGYLAGRLAVAALRAAGPHPTRGAFVKALRSESLLAELLAGEPALAIHLTRLRSQGGLDTVPVR